MNGKPTLMRQSPPIAQAREQRMGHGIVGHLLHKAWKQSEKKKNQKD